LFEIINTPFTSVNGFLEMSTGFNVSNRGAIVRQLVGRPTGKKPASVHIYTFLFYSFCIFFCLLYFVYFIITAALCILINGMDGWISC